MSGTWERVTELFGAARPLGAHERATFLDNACADNPGLRADVERLLADSDCEDTFLAEPFVPSIASLTSLAAAVCPGDMLKDRYRIEAHVGGGGQSIVYRATDTALGRPVIVKIIRASASDHRALASFFESEMQALARIDHAGVVGIFDVGEMQDGRPFLVIQYVPGVSLRETLRAGPLAPARAARLLRELASALSAAHMAGVAHRDLKPDNIMLQPRDDGGETLKLIDFGISKLEGMSTTTSLVMAGTVRYMAPEQFEGRHSAASDVYALSLVACEMLCGHPEIRALPESFDGLTRRLIELGLAFRPEDRPQDVRRWVDALATALEHPYRGRVRRRWLLGTAVAVSIVALVQLPRIVVRGLAAARPQLSDTTLPALNLTGDWAITSVATVCAFLCGSPPGTVYESTATLSQDTPTTFHGTYFDQRVFGTTSGNRITLSSEFLAAGIPARGNCYGTAAGDTLTLNCSAYIKPKGSGEFQLNGSRVDTVVKK